jgi:flagellar biosynthesis protein FlhB
MTDKLTVFFSLQGLFQIIQLAIIPVVLFYIVFAFVVVRQIKLLNMSFSTPIAPVLESTAFIQLIFSMVVAVFALMNL